MMSSSPYAVLGKRSLDQWKVTEVKEEELKRRKLTIKGSKEDLVVDEREESAQEKAADSTILQLDQVTLPLQVDIYEDKDNDARKDEIAAIGGSSSTGANVDVFSASHDRLQEVIAEFEDQQEIENQENGTNIDLDCYSTLEELMEVGPEKLTKALAALGLKTGGTVQECAERLLLTKHRRLEKLDEKHFAKGSCSTEQNGGAVARQPSEDEKEIALKVQKIHELERKLDEKDRELQALRLHIEATRIGRSGVAPTTLGNLLPITHGAVHQNTALGVEVLRSIAFGGQLGSVSTMSFVASSSVATIGTSSIVLLGVGNVIGGAASIIYGLCVLYRDRVDQRDNYVETLGRRDRWLLHAVAAIVSCLICGLLAPLVYGLSFRESDNALQKTLVAVGVSMTCILSMTSLKHYVGGPPRDSTLAYIFIGSSVLATVISYFFVVLFG